MKVYLPQINFHIGNFDKNTSKIINSIEKAKKQGAQIVVFPELAVCGYPPRDFLEFNHFIDRCYESILEIAAKCTGITAVVGAPSRNENPKGKPLFNSAWVLSDGKIQDVIHKTLLPTYDIFDEYRYFEPNRKFSVVDIQGKKVALTICEDLWNVSDDPLYVINPMDELMAEKPELMINIAASPFNYRQEETRINILKLNTQRYQLPLVYVNHVGAQTELIFDGGSLAMDCDGNIIKQLPFFKEDEVLIDFDLLEKAPRNTMPAIEKIHDALVLGIRDYFSKMGFTKAILGLSGGIDSALTAVLAAEALGAENVYGVLLPSKYSSEHSIEDAIQLAKNIGCKYDTVSIENSYQTYIDTLTPYFEGLPFGLAEENLQARTRAVILMALSNKHGYILLNTSNKSEAAVGYGTLYGDMCGGLSVLGDVYKTQVYELSNYINRNKVIIPVNTIIKPPSAELRPNQKDSDSLPDYDILDTILLEYIEHRKGPEEICAMGYDKTLVDRILKMVNTNEYKRHQTPPILRVSPKAFGMGRRMPIAAKYLL